MSKTLAAVLVLALVQSAAAQVRGPTEINIAVGELTDSVNLTIDGDEVNYGLLGSRLKAFREYDSDPKSIKLRLIGYAPETAYIVVSGQKAGKLLPLFVLRVNVGPAPAPTPGPSPTPPPPAPPPAPQPAAPIAGPGFKVLVIFEAMSNSLTAGQEAALYGRTVRNYLESKCAVEPDGKTRAYRIWDKDVNAAGDLKVWQDALKRPRTSVPWIVVSDGTTGFEGPLPTTAAEIEALLRKYGG